MNQSKKRVPIGLFLTQVRQEIAKIKWPKRQEVLLTSVMVFVMVCVFALFFIAIDGVLSFFVKWMLGWGTT